MRRGTSGAWSPTRRGFDEKFDVVAETRKQVTNQCPIPSGISYMCLRIPERSIGADPHLANKLNSLLGKDTGYVSENGKALICKRAPKDSLIYLMLLDGVVNHSSPIVPNYQFLQHMAGETLIDRLLKDPSCFEGFHDNFKELFEIAFAYNNPAYPYTAAPLYRYAFEPDFQWNHVSGITLIGNAAHVMTHFNGDGVDLAMKDALELPEGLVAEREKPLPDRDTALKRFEDRMFQRIPNNTRKAADTMLALFNNEAPDTFVNFMKSVNAPAEGGSDAGATAT